MGAVTNDIIRITDIQNYDPETVLNVYFYRVNLTTELTGDYLDIIGSWFKDNIVTPVAALQTQHLIHTSLFLENLTNGVDIKNYVTDFPITGSFGAVDSMPPFVSYGFQLLRETRSTRNGYKRFAGVPEDVVTDGEYVGDAAPITAVEDALGSDVVLGLVHSLAPVIVHHPIVIPLVSPVVNDISAGLFKGIGTQNTRKFGRGI